MPKRLTPAAAGQSSIDLVKQIEALREQAKAMKAKERPGVVASIKEAIAHYGLTAADLGLTVGVKSSLVATKGMPKAGAKHERKPKRRPGVTTPGKSAVKKRTSMQYKDAAGNFWSGFGPRPQWLKEALATGATEDSLRV